MSDETQLARWLAGEMSGQELEALQDSPEYPSLVKIRDNFAMLEKPQFGAKAMLQEVLRQEKAMPKVVPLYRKVWLPAAAMVIVLLGLVLVFAIPKHEEAAPGKQYAFTLQGEAYFKVAKGKAFTVATGLGKVTVLGTQFNVRARGNRFDVVCYEGKVRVEYKKQVVVIAPHQRVTFENGSGGAIIREDAAIPQWLQGELAFTQIQFQDAVAEISRHYGVTITSTVSSAQRFSGVLPGKELDAALEILATTYHLKVVYSGETITLIPIDANP
jgi:transmembrane sensor